MGTHLSCNNAQPCAPPGSGLSTQLRSRSFLEPTFACFNITHLFPRSRSSRKTLYFLFLAVTRKYAFPLRPLANQNQSAFQHLFQTDLGRSPRGNDSSPTTQEEHKAQKTNNNQVLNTLRRQLKTPKQTNADVQDHASPSVSSVCLTHSFIGEKVCLRVNNS